MCVCVCVCDAASCVRDEMGTDSGCDTKRVCVTDKRVYGNRPAVCDHGDGVAPVTSPAGRVPCLVTQCHAVARCLSHGVSCHSGEYITPIRKPSSVAGCQCGFNFTEQVPGLCYRCYVSEDSQSDPVASAPHGVSEHKESEKHTRLQRHAVMLCVTLCRSLTVMRVTALGLIVMVKV